VREEAHSLKENLYFAQELLLMLDQTGFRDVAIEACPTGRPATADLDLLIELNMPIKELQKTL